MLVSRLERPPAPRERMPRPSFLSFPEGSLLLTAPLLAAPMLATSWEICKLILRTVPGHGLRYDPAERKSASEHDYERS